jgi:periodic tryptophan protein 1
VPVRQELSPEELAALRGKASDEVAQARGGRGGARDADSDDDSAPARGGGAAGAASKAKAKAQDKAKGKAKVSALLDDPAFASLRDVKLPKGFEDLENGGGDDDDDDDEDMDEEDARPSGRGAESDMLDAGAGGATVASAVGGMSAPDTLLGGGGDDDDDDEGSDAEDLVARPRDDFLIVANTEDDYSSLEVHVFNEDDGSLFVHHDLTLPSFPLCVAWMDYAGDAAGGAAGIAGGAALAGAGTGAGYVGSFAAVGTFDPSIEIWNLDVLDPLEPTLVLKGIAPKPAAGKAGKKGGKSKGGAAAGGAGATAAPDAATSGHSAAVMSLSWNRVHRHLLASSSADCTVKVWDVDAGGRVLHTFTHHKGKVQSVAWHPVETSILAAAAYDRTISVVDARQQDTSRAARYRLPADSESLQWNVHNPAAIIASCEDGSVLAFDVRMPDAPLWSVRAHGVAASSVSLSSLASGLMATSSLDKTVKLWDLGVGASSAPVHVATKSLNIGQVFSCSFFPSNPFLLAAGGSKGLVAIWNVAEDGGEGTAAAAGSAAAAAASGGSVAPGAPALPEDASAVARRFTSRMIDPAAVPSLAIRVRPDGQPIE